MYLESSSFYDKNQENIRNYINKINKSMIIVALTPGDSRPLSIMNFECKKTKCHVM